MSNAITPTNPEFLPVPADQRRMDENPAAVYLASFGSANSRRAVKRNLDTITSLMTTGDFPQPGKAGRRKVTRQCPYCRGDVHLDTIHEQACAYGFPWERLRYQHTQAIRARLQAADYSATTANHMLTSLRGVLKQAWLLGLMSAEGYRRAIELEPVKGNSLMAGRHIPYDQIHDLIRACRDDSDNTIAAVRDKAILAILYSCGLRRSEVVNMDLADYQPSEHMLVIRHAKGNRDREADLTDRAEQYLHEWLAIRGDEAGPLFCRIRKNGALVQGRPLTAQAVYNVLKKRAAQAGIDELFTPHDFRRTFVSNLLEAGADLATVSKMAGHANVQTTAKYDRRDREARRKVAALIKVP